MLSVILISLSVTTPSYSSEPSPCPAEEGLRLCDKALSKCDEALKRKEKEVEKQAELLEEQAKQLEQAKSDEDNPVKNPIVWAALGGTIAVAAGPVSIPFVIVGAIVAGIIF